MAWVVLSLITFCLLGSVRAEAQPVRTTVRTLPIDSLPVVLSGPFRVETKVDSVYIERYDDFTRSWYQDDFPPGLYAVEIKNVSTLNECIERQVVFTFENSGTGDAPAANVKRVNGVWTESRRDLATDLRRYLKGTRCAAYVRWHLNDDPGTQHLTAVLQPHTEVVVDSSRQVLVEYQRADTLTYRQSFEVDAVAPPQVFGAIHVLAIKSTVPDGGGRSRFVPVVGLEVPLLVVVYTFAGSFRSVREWAGVRELDRVRFVFGTDPRDFGRDLHIGIQVAPLFIGAKASSLPVQALVGLRVGNSEPVRPFAGLQVSATSLIGTVLSVF